MTKITPKISPIILTSIAGMYQDVHKVIMEYIDNAIDAATTGSGFLIKPDTKIEISKSGKSHIDGTIKILDNCGGINNLTKILTNIGNSSKKQEWTNGQFGFGIFSFLAVCSRLEILTKSSITYTNKVVINESDFNQDDISKIKFNLEQITNSSNGAPFTKITLSKFKKEYWKELILDTLKSEIENHFELLLANPNLTIEINRQGYSKKCEAFNYKKYSGKEYINEIKIKDSTNSGKEHTAKIYLYIKPDGELDRPPVFISKNRRVTKVNSLNVFDTIYRTSIWNNSFVTGYIEVDGILKPDISRNSYKTDKLAKRFFKELRKLEPEIKEKIDEVLQVSSRSNATKIEEEFNNKLKTFLKNKRQKQKTKIEKGDKVRLTNCITEPNWNYLQLNRELHNTTKGSSSNRKSHSNGEIYISKSTSFDSIEYKSGRVKSHEKEGQIMNIKIDNRRDPKLKSDFNGQQVSVFRYHAEFIKRVTNQDGNELISSDLMHYILSEYLFYYLKSENELNPVSIEKLLADYKEFLQGLSYNLKNLINQPINNI